MLALLKKKYPHVSFSKCFCLHLVFQTSTNVYNLLVSMVRAVTWLGRFNVAAMLVGQEHCVTQVHVYVD